MRLIEATGQERERFESFVHANGSFLQDLEWGDFQKAMGRQVFRFLIEGEGGEIFAAAQFILNSAGGKEYLFAPYGPVLSLPNQSRLLDAMEFFGKQLPARFPGLIFIRIEPQFQLSEQIRADGRLRKSEDLNPHKTLVFDLLRDEEQMLQDMHSKTRYNIKVAQKHGVAVNSQTEMQGCGILFLETAKRAGIRAFDLHYYDALMKKLCTGKNVKSKLYTAWHGDDLLAVNLMLYYGDTAIYLFGGSADLKRNMMAPYLLHWEAIKFAKEDGYRKYDFWGIEENPKHPWYGFSRFKLGFGGEVKKYAGTWDYVLSPAWYNTYTFLRKLNRKLRR